VDQGASGNVLLSLDGTGKPISPGTAVTAGGPLPTPFAIGHWLGDVNGSFAMFNAGPTNLALSIFAMPQGGRLQQNATPKLEFADFVPSPPGDQNNPNGNTTQAAAAHILLNGGSPNLVHHRVFAGNTGDPKKQATVSNFVSETHAPRDGIAFIGHAYLFPKQGQPPSGCGTNQYSIGLILAGGYSLIRSPDPNNPCLNYTCQTECSFIQYADPITPNARVIFIGACDDFNGVMAGMWNITAQTQGFALIIPNLSTLPQGSPGGVDLWQSTLEWEQIATNLSNGKTVGQAVNAANQYLQSQSSRFTVPPQAWTIVGDSNVKFRP
jgi:hypothetical protein